MIPRLDKKRTTRILCDGIQIDQTDLDYAVAMKLAELDLIKVKPNRYVRCVYQEDADYPERHDHGCEGVIEVDDFEKVYHCPECGQSVENITRKKQFEAVDVALNPEGIASFLKRSVRSLPHVNVVNRLSHGVFLVTLADGRVLTLVLLDYAEARYRFAGLYFAEPYLYVVVSTINEPITHALEKNVHIQFADILSQDEAWLAEQIDLAAYPVPDRMALESVEKQFEAMLAREDGWQYFEQQFALALQIHITEYPELVAQYLGQLKRLSGTVFNYFAVPIGGPGRTDMRLINKFEVMNNVFAGNAIIDAKRYTKSSHLEEKDIKGILAHLMTDPQRPDRAIIFLSTDQVRSSAWELVLQLKERNGDWKIIILTKYMMLELITQLDAMHLLGGSE